MGIYFFLVSFEIIIIIWCLHNVKNHQWIRISARGRSAAAKGFYIVYEMYQVWSAMRLFDFSLNSKSIDLFIQGVIIWDPNAKASRIKYLSIESDFLWSQNVSLNDDNSTTICTNKATCDTNTRRPDMRPHDIRYRWQRSKKIMIIIIINFAILYRRCRGSDSVSTFFLGWCCSALILNCHGIKVFPRFIWNRLSQLNTPNAFESLSFRWTWRKLRARKNKHIKSPDSTREKSKRNEYAKLYQDSVLDLQLAQKSELYDTNAVGKSEIERTPNCGSNSIGLKIDLNIEYAVGWSISSQTVSSALNNWYREEDEKSWDKNSDGKMQHSLMRNKVF